MIKFFRKKKKAELRVTHVSNVVQYDSMGYPLRLVITSDNDQIWLDTCDCEDDIELIWKEI